VSLRNGNRLQRTSFKSRGGRVSYTLHIVSLETVDVYTIEQAHIKRGHGTVCTDGGRGQALYMYCTYSQTDGGDI
jgi:hypothetical protein